MPSCKHKNTVVGVDVAVNNIKVLSVAMEMQQLLPCVLLYSYGTFRTAVNNANY